MTAAFGSPSPLPGQPGFNVKASEVMARETTEMEVLLSRLKRDLDAEAEIRNTAGSNFGGARWRSARIDRGSVRSYAKDVKNRYQQQRQQAPPHGAFFESGSLDSQGRIKTHAGAGARAAAALRVEKERQKAVDQGGDRYFTSSSESDRRESSDPGYASKEVNEWSVRNTLEWLHSLGLGKLKKVFEQNEISGAILLEVGSDDLDYMNIQVLAHRKRILTGIEELRRGTYRPKVDVHLPAVPPIQPEERGGVIVAQQMDSDVPNTDREVGLEKTRKSPRVKRVQRESQFRPLSDNQTEDSDGRKEAPVVNLAEGQYNEAAVGSSFADAVAEWRRYQPQHATGAVSSPTKSDSAAGALRDGSITTNSFNAPGSGKSGGLLSCGAAAECWMNPFASLQARETNAMAPASADRLTWPESARSSPSKLATAATAGEGSGQTVSIAPTLDEEAEHAAFRRAVAEWNRGGKGDAKYERCPKDDEGRADGESETQDVALPRRTAEAVAEALRKQMDDEHRAQARKLEGQKRNALEGLEAARRYNSTKFQAVRNLLGQVEDRCRAEKECTESHQVEGESKRSRASCSEREEGKGPGPRCARETETESLSTGSSQDFGEDGEATDCDGVRSDVAEEGRGVEIEFVESVLGGDLPSGEGMGYLVDEGGSEDGGL